MKAWLAALALASLALPILALQARPVTAAASIGEGYVDASPQELRALLDRNDPFLLDVHVPNEGYLAGTDARIPYTEIGTRAAELPADRHALIVVYCMSGRMSEIAATELVGLGYRNVVNLAGGMLAWQAAGYEIVPE